MCLLCNNCDSDEVGCACCGIDVTEVRHGVFVM